MRLISVIDEDGELICEDCEVAETPLTRMRGLLGRRALPEGEGMLIEPTWSVHTCFMRFPIDVVFLDREFRVLEVVAGLAPWHATAHRGARAALELPAGTAEAAGLEPGKQLAWGVPDEAAEETT